MLCRVLDSQVVARSVWRVPLLHVAELLPVNQRHRRKVIRLLVQERHRRASREEGDAIEVGRVALLPDEKCAAGREMATAEVDR